MSNEYEANEAVITEIPTKEFYLSLDKRHGRIDSYYDPHGNLWVIFTADDDPLNLNVINFFGAEE